MAKKATTTRSRAKSSKQPSVAPLAVERVYRVGGQEFASEDAAKKFCEQSSRRTSLSLLAAAALAKAPARGRGALKAGYAHLVEAIVADPAAFAAALADAPTATVAAVANPPPAPRAPRSRSKPPVTGAAPKKRVRRTKAQIAADEAAAKNGAGAPSETPQEQPPTTPASPPAGSLPPPPP